MNQASKHGFIFGLLCPGDWRAKKEATMYSYNGVVLPKLPEWDKEIYPYAFISKTTSNNKNYYYLHCYTVLPTTNEDGWGTVNVLVPTGAKGMTNGPIIDKWVSFAGPTEITYSPGYEIPFAMVVWTNFDVYNLDGTLYMGASAPVPVYE